MNVNLMLAKTSIVRDPHIRKSPLPYFPLKSQFPLCSEGETAFDQLHRHLKTGVTGHSQKNVNMIRHDDEVVDGELSGLHIGAQNLNEEIRHALSLEQ